MTDDEFNEVRGDLMEALANATRSVVKLRDAGYGLQPIAELLLEAETYAAELQHKGQ